MAGRSATARMLPLAQPTNRSLETLAMAVRDAKDLRAERYRPCRETVRGVGGSGEKDEHGSTRRAKECYGLALHECELMGSGSLVCLQ